MSLWENLPVTCYFRDFFLTCWVQLNLLTVSSVVMSCQMRPTESKTDLVMLKVAVKTWHNTGDTRETRTVLTLCVEVTSTTANTVSLLVNPTLQPDRWHLLSSTDCKRKGKPENLLRDCRQGSTALGRVTEQGFGKRNRSCNHLSPKAADVETETSSLWVNSSPLLTVGTRKSYHHPMPHDECPGDNQQNGTALGNPFSLKFLLVHLSQCAGTTGSFTSLELLFSEFHLPNSSFNFNLK